MGISFAKGVERPITVMGIEKKIQVSFGWTEGYGLLVSHMPSF